MSDHNSVISVVNGVTLNTKHYIAGVDVNNKTFTIWSDFSDTEIMEADRPDGACTDLINELKGLESMIRRMLEDKDGI